MIYSLMCLIVQLPTHCKHHRKCKSNFVEVSARDIYFSLSINLQVCWPLQRNANFSPLGVSLINLRILASSYKHFIIIKFQSKRLSTQRFLITAWAKKKRFDRILENSSKSFPAIRVVSSGSFKSWNSYWQIIETRIIRQLILWNFWRVFNTAWIKRKKTSASLRDSEWIVEKEKGNCGKAFLWNISKKENMML